MDPVRTELSRAWENYFAQRGGSGITAPTQALPVVLFDDTTHGPYPPCRLWQAAHQYTPQAGVYPKIGLKNVDGGYAIGAGAGLTKLAGGQSVVVVDQIIIQRGAVACQVYINTGHHDTFDIGFDAGPADDIAPEKDIGALWNQPSLGSVHIGPRQVGLAVGNVNNGLLPGFGDGLGHILQRSFILGPGQILWVQTDSAGNTLYASFSGRYYSAP